jgi:hypothetical protein
LDHLACLAVKSNHGTVTENTAFPIWRKERPPTGPQYKSLVIGKVKGAKEPVIDLVQKLEPHFGGADEPLRIVDYLDIADKHRQLIVAFYYGGVVLNTPGKFGVGAPSISMSIQISAKGPAGSPLPVLKDGDPIYIGPIEQDTYNNHHYEPFADISLGEPWALQGKAVLPALTELAEFVEGVIDKFRVLL